MALQPSSLPLNQPSEATYYGSYVPNGLEGTGSFTVLNTINARLTVCV
jgi:hypothetical protein